jgi:predicted XRE-type DNA-binding protein
MTSSERPDFKALGLDPRHIGSSADDWLSGEGFMEEIHEEAVKELLAEQLLKAMEEKRLTKKAFAAAIHTSRSQLDRILDPHDEGVTIGTLKRAAAFVGMSVRLELVAAENVVRNDSDHCNQPSGAE